MKKITLEIEEPGELRALYRAIYMAKVCAIRKDSVLRGSRPLASVENRIADTLNEAVVNTAYEESYAIPDEARAVTEDHEIWGAMIESFVDQKGAWVDWNLNEKQDYVRTIFSPLTISDPMIDVFISIVDS